MTEKKIVQDFRNETGGPNAGMVHYEGEDSPRFPDSEEPESPKTKKKGK